jgi:flagellar basal-body rod modification protein FlgD
MNVNSATTASTTTSGVASTKLADNYSTFLKMLTTQLQNQDPTSPLDTNEFTTQLVQFTSVEQSIQQNKNLETLIAMSQSNGLVSAASFIGQDVTAKTATGQLGAKGLDWTYSLGANAETNDLVIKSSSGNVVATLPGATKRGQHDIHWDGTVAGGGKAPAGTYTLEPAATDSNGASINVNTALTGRVSAIESDASGISVIIGGTAVPITQISRVAQPSAPQNVDA